MHYAKSLGGRTRHPNRPNRQKLPVPAFRFREARHALRLTVHGCADLLRVSERTVRGWESGATRIPYAAFKLMRVLRGGRLLEHPDWRDFIVRGQVLVTPEGHELIAGDLGWLSLLVRRARAFSDLLAVQRTASASQRPEAAPAAPDGSCPACRPVGQQDDGGPAAPASGAAAGLVYSSTSDTRLSLESGSTAEKQGVSLVERTPPAPGPQPRLRRARDPAGGSGPHRLRAALRVAGGEA